MRQFIHAPVSSVCRTECIVYVHVAKFGQRSTKFLHLLGVGFHLLIINITIDHHQHHTHQSTNSSSNSFCQDHITPGPPGNAGVIKKQ